MDLILFFVLPAAVATGSAMICYVLMHARMEVAVAREKTERAHIETRLEMIEELLPEKLRLAEEAAERRAFEQLLTGLRVEERRQIREGAVPAMIMQERLFFRNMPLSAWIEHELPNASHGSESLSVFASPVNLIQLASAVCGPSAAAQPEPVAAGAELTQPRPVRTRATHSLRLVQ